MVGPWFSAHGYLSLVLGIDGYGWLSIRRRSGFRADIAAATETVA